MDYLEILNRVGFEKSKQINIIEFLNFKSKKCLIHISFLLSLFLEWQGENLPKTYTYNCEILNLNLDKINLI